MTHLTRRRFIALMGSLTLLVAVVMVAAVFIGPERVDWRALIAGADPRSYAIVTLSRLPRVLLAAVVGLALSSAGASYQVLLRNPLADPFILGVAGGAALASIATVGLGAPMWASSFAAFGGAAMAMIVIFALARTRAHLPVHTLLLTGVVFNAFCFALILFINAVVRIEQAYQILFLLIGNLDVVDYGLLSLTAAFVALGFGVLCAFAGRMNAMSLGDDEATSLGVDVERMRRIIFFAGSLMVGAAVAAAGLIGFVGLFVPHAARIVIGADHRALIPASGLIGAAFLVAADTAARTVLMHTDAATQLPVGVVTALIGAPAFMWLMRRQIRGAL